MATYTIDASVFINSFNPYESGYEDSHRFMSWIYAEAQPVIVPVLLLPELAATIGRGRQDAALARQFVEGIYDLAHFTFINVDEAVAWQGVGVAADHGLRGSDAIYAAVALRFGATLVTLDQEQYERVSTIITTRYPAEIVAETPNADTDAQNGPQ